MKVEKGDERVMEMYFRLVRFLRWLNVCAWVGRVPLAAVSHEQHTHVRPIPRFQLPFFDRSLLRLQERFPHVQRRMDANAAYAGGR